MSKNNINIGKGHDADPRYRYRMPKLASKQESGGNGKKTLFTNWLEVSKALHRKPAYLAKYFASVLSANVDFSEETAFCEFRGHIEQAALQGHVNTFVEKYVLCPKCRLPETFIEVEDQAVFYQCNACGARSKASSDKLTKYIVQHPPEARQSMKDDEEDQGITADIEAPEASLPADDAIEWATDTSDKAALDRQKEAIGDNVVLKSLTVTTGSSSALEPKPKLAQQSKDYKDDPIKVIHAELDLARSHLDPDNPDLDGLVAEMKPKKAQGVFAVWFSLIDPEWEDSADIMSNLKKFGSCLLQIVDCDDPKEQKNNQKIVLKSVERSLFRGQFERQAIVPLLFMELYQQNIVPEDAFLDWESKPPKKDKPGEIPKEVSIRIREWGSKFFEWLRTAEVEE